MFCGAALKVVSSPLQTPLLSLLPLQVFHCHFNNNFFPLFLEHLLSDNITASTGSLLLGEREDMTAVQVVLKHVWCYVRCFILS